MFVSMTKTTMTRDRHNPLSQSGKRSSGRSALAALGLTMILMVVGGAGCDGPEPVHSIPDDPNARGRGDQEADSGRFAPPADAKQTATPRKTPKGATTGEEGRESR